ncbi:MAG: hypothetical protein HOW73_47880 [Polyangiaceae bacterium]|nr:hypothetical protein [Polyangiaceae bacterium]
MEATHTNGAETAPTEPPPPAPTGELRPKTVDEAITHWRRAMEEHSRLKWDAEVAEAKALVAADGKNEAVRKAQAVLASASAHKLADEAKAQALAAEAMVVALVGAPIGGRR